MASAKAKGLGRIRSRLNLSFIWIICSKTIQNIINQIQKRAPLIVCNEPNLNIDKLVELDKSITIHIKNITTLFYEQNVHPKKSNITTYG